MTRRTTSWLTALILTAGSVMAEQSLIDDFEGSPDTRWRFFADTVMGGVSSGAVSFSRDDGQALVRLQGKVSTANNGGFIQIRHELAERPPSDIEGVRLVVRGNGQPYFIHLRTSGTVLPWQYYQAEYDAKTEWREVRLPLDAFKASGNMLRKVPKPGSLKSVAIVAYGRDHEALVEVREIGFY